MQSEHPHTIQATPDPKAPSAAAETELCLSFNTSPGRAELGCLVSRGNSKYHYYGIRLKPDSPLNRLQEDTQYMAMRQQPVHQKPRWVTRAEAGLRKGVGPGFFWGDIGREFIKHYVLCIHARGLPPYGRAKKLMITSVSSVLGERRHSPPVACREASRTLGLSIQPR